MHDSITYRATSRPLRLSVRSALSVDSQRVQRYRMTFVQTMEHCARLIRHGCPPKSLLVDESTPDDQVVLQAEVMNSHRFIDMRYCLHSGIGMRGVYALPSSFGLTSEMKLPQKAQCHQWGILAVALLRQYLDTPSMDKLEEILEQYADSVVELSTYPMAVGILQWNTIFWEVRSY